MATFIVVLGPPGVGKGTQAKILCERTGLAHISSGDLFRENLKNQTELGKLAQTYMTKGELVPDDVTIAMIKERLTRPDCAMGAILDGFPRTPAQADALETLWRKRMCWSSV
jgi:adenylate kinase